MPLDLTGYKKFEQDPKLVKRLQSLEQEWKRAYPLVEGIIRKFIDKKGEGVYHLSYEVDDIEAEVAALKTRGIDFVTPKPYLNAHQDLVIFMHPKSTKGVLMELIQYQCCKKTP